MFFLLDFVYIYLHLTTVYCCPFLGGRVGVLYTFFGINVFGSVSLWDPTYMHCAHLAPRTRPFLCGCSYGPYVTFRSYTYLFVVCKIFTLGVLTERGGLCFCMIMHIPQSSRNWLTGVASERWSWTLHLLLFFCPFPSSDIFSLVTNIDKVTYNVFGERGMRLLTHLPH